MKRLKVGIALAFLASIGMSKPLVAENLISGPPLAKAIAKYFGGKTGDYFLRHQSIGDQVMIGLGMPDAMPGPFKSGPLQLITGCRPHSCTQKSAVVVDRHNRVVNVALITSKQTKENNPTQYNMTQIVTIFNKRAVSNKTSSDLIINWASKVIPGAEVQTVPIK